VGLKLYTAVGLNVIYRNRNSVWTCASPKRDSDAFSDKRCPKIGGFALRAVPGSRCRDVIRMLKRWRRQGCRSRGKGTAGRGGNRLGSTPFVAMVQAAKLRDLHDLSSLRPLHDASSRGVLG